MLRGGTAQNRLSPGAPDLYGTEKAAQDVLRHALKVFIAGEEKPSLETASCCTLLPKTKEVEAPRSAGAGLDSCRNPYSPDKILPTARAAFQLDGSFER